MTTTTDNTDVALIPYRLNGAEIMVPNRLDSYKRMREVLLAMPVKALVRGQYFADTNSVNDPENCRACVIGEVFRKHGITKMIKFDRWNNDTGFWTLWSDTSTNKEVITELFNTYHPDVLTHLQFKNDSTLVVACTPERRYEEVLKMVEEKIATEKDC